MRSTFRSNLVIVSFILAGLVAQACSEPQPPGSVAAGKASKDASASASRTPSHEAGIDKAAGSLAIVDGGADEAPRLGAMFMETPILSDMEWPEKERDRQRRSARDGHDKGESDKVLRLGYLRHGSSAPVLPEAHVLPNCLEGWYELVAGGFVCGKYATLDMNHPRVRLAPHPPDVSAALPYQYGYNLTHGTPLYRQIPSRKERMRYEPWLSPRPKPKPQPEEDTNPYAEEAEGNAASMMAGLAVGSARDPLNLGIDEDAGTPWYLREFDGGKPQITLDELRGEGPIARRMVRGFFVALDKDMTAGKDRWWRTTAGNVVPYERLMPHKPPTTFHGVWLKDDAPPWPAVLEPGALPATAPSAGSRSDAGAESIPAPVAPPPTRKPAAGPVAFMWSGKGKHYALSADRKRVTAGEPMEYRTTARLTGDSVKVAPGVYVEVDDGSWLRASDLVTAKAGPPPSELAPGERWIDVNLTNQTLVALEGSTPVFATLVSSGKEDKEDPEKDHKTPVGTYRIWAKHIAATMDGDVASDGPYSIEDVPWIMYFKGSYALHGAFWHGMFGRERSHGCVNLSPSDARALFGWTEPRLPEGWHGVNATESRPGTLVVVHE
jgi:lipoprotein-anchoring transpeptidase ErfK/SrfK